MHLIIKNIKIINKHNLLKCCFLLLMNFILLNTKCYSQKEEIYDEIGVILNVERVGTIEIPIVIDNQIAYLPVKEIFDFLKIKNTQSLQLEQIEGFFINPQSRFLIDKYKNQIVYLDKTYPLKPNDLLKTETGIYLKIDYFGKIFGLDCSFNFRNLSVTMNTKIELPTIKEMQQEILRQNISKLQGEKKVDTVIKRTFPKFQIGMADCQIRRGASTWHRLCRRNRFLTQTKPGHCACPGSGICVSGAGRAGGPSQRLLARMSRPGGGGCFPKRCILGGPGKSPGMDRSGVQGCLDRRSEAEARHGIPQSDFDSLFHRERSTRRCRCFWRLVHRSREAVSVDFRIRSQRILLNS